MLILQLALNFGFDQLLLKTAIKQATLIGESFLRPIGTLLRWLELLGQSHSCFPRPHFFIEFNGE